MKFVQYDPYGVPGSYPAWQINKFIDEFLPAMSNKVFMINLAGNLAIILGICTINQNYKATKQQCFFHSLTVFPDPELKLYNIIKLMIILYNQKFQPKNSSTNYF